MNEPRHVLLASTQQARCFRGSLRQAILLIRTSDALSFHQQRKLLNARAPSSLLDYGEDVKDAGCNIRDTVCNRHAVNHGHCACSQWSNGPRLGSSSPSL